MRVTVKYVNYPSKVDAKYGNIKTSDDQTIMVPVARLAEFTKGATLDILVETKTWGNGADARPVTVLDGRSPQVNPYAGQGAQPGPNRSNPEQGNQGRQTDPAPGGAPYQAAQAGHQAPAPGPARSNPEARSIFITGVVGRAMGSGKFSASEIQTLTEEAARSYDQKLTP